MMGRMRWGLLGNQTEGDGEQNIAKCLKGIREECQMGNAHVGWFSLQPYVGCTSITSQSLCISGEHFPSNTLQCSLSIPI